MLHLLVLSSIVAAARELPSPSPISASPKPSLTRLRGGGDTACTDNIPAGFMRLRGGHHMDCTNYITAGVGGLMAVTGAAAFVSPSGCLRLICVPESEASHESSLAYMRYMAATILTMVAALAAGNTDDYAAAGPVILYGNALALLTSIPNLERLGCPKLPLVVLILAQALLATLTCVEVIDKDLTLVITAIWALLNGLQLQILPKMNPTLYGIKQDLPFPAYAKLRATGSMMMASSAYLFALRSKNHAFALAVLLGSYSAATLKFGLVDAGAVSGLARKAAFAEAAVEAVLAAVAYNAYTGGDLAHI